MKKIFIIIFLFLITHSLQAQVNMDNSFMPNSPSQMGNGVGTSVNLPTGTLQVNIPLGSISGKNMQMPISLGYAATGIQVMQQAGNVGMGWSLGVGGMITRVVRDKPDDGVNGYAGYNYGTGINNCGKTGYTVNNLLDCNTALTTAQRTFLYFNPNDNKFANYTSYEDKWDTQPDVYYFNVMGISGRFVLNHKGEAILTPYQNLKISVETQATVSCNQEFFKWVITDGSGISYVFEKGERIEKTISYPNPCNGTTITINQSYTSSWYLKEIISPNGKSELFIKYETQPDYSYQYTIKNRYNKVANLAVKNGCVPPSLINITVQETLKNRQFIESIESSKGKVVFDYTHSRLDLTGSKALEQIRILNHQSTQVAKIRFSYLYHKSASGSINRLRSLFLRQVQINDLPPYRFNYFGNTISPLANFEMDEWGFYNANGSTDAIVAAGPPFNLLTGSDRSPNLEACRLGTLRKILYPTGGALSVVYELNSYLASGNQNKAWGGLRVKQMITTDEKGQEYVKEYLYDRSPENKPSYSSGTINTELYPINFIKTFSFYNYVIRSSHPDNSNVLGEGANLIYKYVTERELGKGKAVHYFSHFENALYRDEPSKKYEIRTSPVANNCITENAFIKDAKLPPYIPPTSRAWRRGLPLLTKTYHQSGRLLTETRYTYQFNTEVPYPRNTQGQHLYQSAYGIEFDLEQTTSYINGVAVTHQNMFGFYEERSEWFYLEKETQFVYDLEDPNNIVNLSTSTEYSYNSKNLQIKEIKTIDSEGRILKTTNKYAADFLPTASVTELPFMLAQSTQTFLPNNDEQLYKEMLARGMTGTLIEQRVEDVSSSQAPILLGASIKRYHLIDTETFAKTYLANSSVSPPSPHINLVRATRRNINKLIYLEDDLSLEIQKPIASSNYQAAALNSSGNLVFDNRFKSSEIENLYNLEGQVIQTKTKNAPYTSYIYDPETHQVIAEVANAEANQIGYEGFETLPQQNWIYNRVGRIIPPEGQQSYTGSGSFEGTLKREYLASGVYTVSMRARKIGNNPILTVNAQNKTVSQSEFKYFEWEVSLGSTANPTVTIQAQNVFIDEVRIHPIKAKMTNYTHKHLVGLAAVTDATGQTLFYEYDTQNRKKRIIDNENNVIEAYQYHYQKAVANITNINYYGCLYVGTPKDFFIELGVQSAIPNLIWEFGDGSAKKFGTNVTHTYTQPGLYTLKLTAQHPDLQTEVIETQILVSQNLIVSSECNQLNPSSLGDCILDICDFYGLEVQATAQGGNAPYTFEWFTKNQGSTFWMSRPEWNNQQTVGIWNAFTSFEIKCKITDSCGNATETAPSLIEVYSSCGPGGGGILLQD